MNADIRRTDVELLERLSDAAMRAGHTQTAIEGYSWALRLRANLAPEPSEFPDVRNIGFRIGEDV